MKNHQFEQYEEEANNNNNNNNDDDDDNVFITILILPSGLKFGTTKNQLKKWIKNQ